MMSAKNWVKDIKTIKCQRNDWITSDRLPLKKADLRHEITANAFM